MSEILKILSEFEADAKEEMLYSDSTLEQNDSVQEMGERILILTKALRIAIDQLNESYNKCVSEDFWHPSLCNRIDSSLSEIQSILEGKE